MLSQACVRKYHVCMPMYIIAGVNNLEVENSSNIYNVHTCREASSAFTIIIMICETMNKKDISIIVHGCVHTAATIMAYS